MGTYPLEVITASRKRYCNGNLKLLAYAANSVTDEIHDHMPVLLDAYQIDAWVNGTAGTDALKPASRRSATHLAGMSAVAGLMIALFYLHCLPREPKAAANSLPSSLLVAGANGSLSVGRYNVCPTDTIDVVLPREGGFGLVQMRWGLIPWWWRKSKKEVPATFNARAVGIAATRLRKIDPAKRHPEERIIRTAPSC